MSLGEQIYRLRVENHMSQGDFAQALGVSRQSVSKWETNASIPELDKLVGMSEIFHISLDELVRGEKQEQAADIPPPFGPEQKTGLPARKIIGFILLGVGFIVFLLFLLVADPLAALVFAAPFVVCAAICLLVAKRTLLWCCWAVYLLVYAYLRYATGIRLWWIFMGWIYRGGLEVHALVAWGQFLALAALLIVTGRLAYKILHKRR